MHAGIRFIPEAPEGFNGKFTFREVQNIPSLLPCTPDDTWIISSEPGFYPDALVPITKELDVAAHCWHAVWVSVDIPEDAAKRICRGEVVVGMTPDQVKLTYGPPAKIRTPQEENESWIYWITPSENIRLVFRSGQVRNVLNLNQR